MRVALDAERRQEADGLLVRLAERVRRAATNRGHELVECLVARSCLSRTWDSLGGKNGLIICERQENLGPQLPAAQQDKTAGRTELPHQPQKDHYS